jgi:tetratricopeptide (TPR) repeat protein
MSSRRIRAVIVAIATAFAASACGQYSLSNIRAMKAFKDGNVHYQRGEFKQAAERYEAAMQHNPEFYGLTYFFIGNSYDQLYKPSRKGEPDNDANLQKAVENYKLAVQKIRDDEPDAAKYRKYSFDWLIAAYGADKLDDFAQAEPIAKQMISMEPNEPSNHQALGKLYEDQGRYDEAEVEYKKAVDLRPADPLGYQVLAGFYNRQGQFEKTMDAWYARANAEPNNPEAWHTISTYYSDKVMRQKNLPKKTAMEYVLKGIGADDKALAINPEYFEAVSYKNILLRQQANLETDPAVQKRLINEADDLLKKALELQKKQAVGAVGEKKAGGK